MCSLREPSTLVHTEPYPDRHWKEVMALFVFFPGNNWFLSMWRVKFFPGAERHLSQGFNKQWPMWTVDAKGIVLNYSSVEVLGGRGQNYGSKVLSFPQKLGTLIIFCVSGLLHLKPGWNLAGARR